MTTQAELRQAHADLLACYEETREEFADLDDRTLARFLSKYDSPELRQQVRVHGDGHSLYSLPRTVDELEAVDVVVLFAVTSPKLGYTSVFNRFTPLHSISYWRDDKRLCSRVSAGTRLYRLHFMAWQQNFAIHGVDDAHARRNRSLLLNRNTDLIWLLQQERDAATEFVIQCCDWLTNNGKSMVVISEISRTNFTEPILSLRANPLVIRIEAKLRGKNYGIMEQISRRLP